MNIGIGIKKIRKELGLKQYMLAELVGITPTSLSMIEKGIKFPSKSHFDKICAALNTSPVMVYYKSINLSDIPPSKIKLWCKLNPVIEKLLSEVLFKN